MVSPFISYTKTLRINVYYWREKVPGSYSVSQAFPCILSLGQAPHHIYGLPASEYPGLMKVSKKAKKATVLYWVPMQFWAFIFNSYSNIPL